MPITETVKPPKPKKDKKIAPNNPEIVRTKRRFQQTPPDQLEAKEIKSAFDNEIFEETFGAEDDEGVSDREVTKMWAAHMHDFVPEDMVNFIIPKGEHVILYETIGHQTPTTIKGAYFVKGGGNTKYVSVMVLDPTRQVVYMKKEAP